jgi:hypothetical protein
MAVLDDSPVSFLLRLAAARAGNVRHLPRYRNLLKAPRCRTPTSISILFVRASAGTCRYLGEFETAVERWEEIATAD